MRIFDIFEGWSNLALGLDTDGARLKAEICKTCEHAKQMKIEIIEDKQIKEISGLCCDICHCPLSAKLRSSSKCDLNKF